jgi:hypothetical protein
MIPIIQSIGMILRRTCGRRLRVAKVSRDRGGPRAKCSHLSAYRQFAMTRAGAASSTRHHPSTGCFMSRFCPRRLDGFGHRPPHVGPCRTLAESSGEHDGSMTRSGQHVTARAQMESAAAGANDTRSCIARERAIAAEVRRSVRHRRPTQMCHKPGSPSRLA